MTKRVYVLEYDILVNLYSSDGYKTENRKEYFARNERDQFIERYFVLKDKYYIENLLPYFAELVEVSVEAMAEQI